MAEVNINILTDPKELKNFISANAEIFSKHSVDIDRSAQICSDKASLEGLDGELAIAVYFINSKVNKTIITHQRTDEDEMGVLKRYNEWAHDKFGEPVKTKDYASIYQSGNSYIVCDFDTRNAYIYVTYPAMIAENQKDT